MAVPVPSSVPPVGCFCSAIDAPRACLTCTCPDCGGVGRFGSGVVHVAPCFPTPTAREVGVRDPGVFVPVLKHVAYPAWMPATGRASGDFESAKARVLEFLANPAFERGWVVSLDEVVEVTL